MCPYASHTGSVDSASGMAVMLSPFIVLAVFAFGRFFYLRWQEFRLARQMSVAPVSTLDILAQAETIAEQAWSAPLIDEEISSGGSTELDR